MIYHKREPLETSSSEHNEHMNQKESRGPETPPVVYLQTLKRCPGTKNIFINLFQVSLSNNAK